MEYVKKYSIKDLYNQIFGKKVRLKSDCEFFPNFDISCKVVNIYIRSTEIMLDVIVLSNNKKLTIGSNMKNLQFELL